MSNELRKDVYELLCLFEGPNPREAFKFSYDDPKLYESDGVTFRRPRDHRDNKWITEDAENGRYLVLRSQVPDHLEDAYDIALGDDLFEQNLLKTEDQFTLYKSLEIPLPRQDKEWRVFPANSDALVCITSKGRAAIARYTTKSSGEDVLRTESVAVPDDGSRDLTEPVLTKDEETILMYLHAKYPSLQIQVDIESSTQIARKVVGSCLKALRDDGYTHRRKGERKGECLTDSGKKLAERLARRANH